jgi:hypothetical protein
LVNIQSTAANRPRELALCPPASLSLPRTSDILRNILSQNPDVQVFSVERILAAIGANPNHLETSLVMFSLPAIVPVPAPRGMVTLPTTAIASQLISGGQKPIQLPRFVRRKAVSRRALAVAIHAALPVLEAAEKIMRPRWSWVSESAVRRAVGLFVFLLAIGVAFPLFGFSSLHATSIFVMALGMAEKDGLAVLVGMAVGVLSFALIAASGMSARALRSKAVKWLRKMGRKLGILVVARALQRRGYTRLAKLLTLQWSDVLMCWDPERGAPWHDAAPRAAAPRVAALQPVSKRAASPLLAPAPRAA